MKKIKFKITVIVFGTAICPDSKTEAMIESANREIDNFVAEKLHNNGIHGTMDSIKLIITNSNNNVIFERKSK